MEGGAADDGTNSCGRIQRHDCEPGDRFRGSSEVGGSSSQGGRGGNANVEGKLPWQNFWIAAAVIELHSHGRVFADIVDAQTVDMCGMDMKQHCHIKGVFFD